MVSVSREVVFSNDMYVSMVLMSLRVTVNWPSTSFAKSSALQCASEASLLHLLNVDVVVHQIITLTLLVIRIKIQLLQLIIVVKMMGNRQQRCIEK